MKQKHKTSAILALTASVFLWGASFGAARQVLLELHPMTLMAFRLTLASLAILPFVKKIKPPEQWRKDWKILLPMVLFQPCLYFLLETNALRFTTSSQAGVISSFVPLLVTLGALIFLSERLRRRGIIGLLLSMAGVILLTLLNRGREEGSAIILGNLMEFGAMVCAASNMLIIKRLSGRYNPWTLTMFQCFAGFLFFLPGFVIFFRDGASLTVNHMLLILYLGAPVSLGAFGLYNWGMSHVTASGASLFINLVPVISVLIGWLILGERLSTGQLLASAAVLAGVVISQDSSRTVKKTSRRSGSKIFPLWSSRN